MTSIASPCINVCEMNATRGLCRGCLRTLAEIAGWAGAADEEKIAILARIDQRRAEFDPLAEQLRSECER